MRAAWRRETLQTRELFLAHPITAGKALQLSRFIWWHWYRLSTSSPWPHLLFPQDICTKVPMILGKVSLFQGCHSTVISLCFAISSNVGPLGPFFRKAHLCILRMFVIFYPNFLGFYFISFFNFIFLSQKFVGNLFAIIAEYMAFWPLFSQPSIWM